MFESIDEYMARFPSEVQALLKRMRATIKRRHPRLRKDQLRHPDVYLDGNLVHYAAYKGHIGFYPALRHRGVQKELSAHKGARLSAVSARRAAAACPGEPHREFRVKQNLSAKSSQHCGLFR
jgi:hypothetical protein